jgi:hypothetical protein
MSRRTFCVEVERTVTYRRKVWVEVEETDERLKDEKVHKPWFEWEAKDHAEDLARKHTLTGWETSETEYRAVSAVAAAPGGNVDVVT